MRPLLAALFLAGCAGLPAAPKSTWVEPAATGATVQVCWIDTGGTSVARGYGIGGSTEGEQWDVTAPAVLLRHPSGDLLIDSGISFQAQEEAKALTGWRRFVFDQTAGRSQPRRNVKDSLAALGVTRLKAVILSHAHADHAGGLVALTDVPVWLGADEAAFVSANPRQVVMPAHAKALENRMVSIPFEAKPYATYEQSFDVFGDGSVVVVPTAGHTPGSVATFVRATGGKRLLHVGDLINLAESIDKKVGKSWLMSTLTDEDADATAREVARLVELHEKDPSLTILPAHDRALFVTLFGEGTPDVPPCL
jgi:N-acyl homoserine lactone hydrolase